MPAHWEGGVRAIPKSSENSAWERGRRGRGVQGGNSAPPKRSISFKESSREVYNYSTTLSVVRREGFEPP